MTCLLARKSVCNPPPLFKFGVRSVTISDVTGRICVNGGTNGRGARIRFVRAGGEIPGLAVLLGTTSNKHDSTILS